jgi:hypothetical protein
MQKTVAPPFVPKLTSARDISNFDSDFTNDQPVLSQEGTQGSGSSTQLDNSCFEGFGLTLNWLGRRDTEV